MKNVSVSCLTASQAFEELFNPSWFKNLIFGSFKNVGLVPELRNSVKAMLSLDNKSFLILAFTSTRMKQAPQ